MEPVAQILPPLAPSFNQAESQPGGPRTAPEVPPATLPAQDEAALDEAQDRAEVPIERRLEQINRLTKHLSFFYHEPTDRVQIRVADGNGKLVREIPSDEFLRTMERLHGNAGAILDDRA